MKMSQRIFKSAAHTQKIKIANERTFTYFTISTSENKVKISKNQKKFKFKLVIIVSINLVIFSFCWHVCGHNGNYSVFLMKFGWVDIERSVETTFLYSTTDWSRLGKNVLKNIYFNETYQFSNFSNINLFDKCKLSCTHFLNFYANNIKNLYFMYC